MRKKRLVLGTIVCLMWIGSLWMAFWSGFSCHLGMVVETTPAADKARLIEHRWLLHTLDDVDVESARTSLIELARFDEERFKLDRQMPPFGITDIAFAGLTNPKESISLIRVGHAVAARTQHPSDN